MPPPACTLHSTQSTACIAGLELAHCSPKPFLPVYIMLQWQRKTLHYEVSGRSVSSSLQAEKSGLGRREVAGTAARSMRGIQGLPEQLVASRSTNEWCAAALRCIKRCCATGGVHARGADEGMSASAAAAQRALAARAPHFSLCSAAASPGRLPRSPSPRQRAWCRSSTGWASR